MEDKIKIFLAACFFCICSICNGQPSVNKMIDEDGDAYLRILLRKGQDTVDINLYEGFEKELSDKEKLQLIECLLKFEGDTTRHGGRVFPVYYGTSAVYKRFSPKSKYQTLEINALYFIDRIAYGIYTDYYSPAPVLYDNETGIEINDNPEKVAIVFESYRKWFEECIKNEEIPKYYPFNDGRYVWFYGQKSYFSKDGVPIYKEPHF